MINPEAASTCLGPAQAKQAPMRLPGVLQYASPAGGLR